MWGWAPVGPQDEVERDGSVWGPSPGRDPGQGQGMGEDAVTPCGSRSVAGLQVGPRPRARRPAASVSRAGQAGRCCLVRRRPWAGSRSPAERPPPQSCKGTDESSCGENSWQQHDFSIFLSQESDKVNLINYHKEFFSQKLPTKQASVL